MGNFPSLEQAAMHAAEVGADKCGDCKHWFRMPIAAQDGKQYGHCREQLHVVLQPAGVIPVGEPASVGNRPIGTLHIADLCRLLLPRTVTSMYPQTPIDFPACGRFCQRIERPDLLVKEP